MKKEHPKKTSRLKRALRKLARLFICAVIAILIVIIIAAGFLYFNIYLNQGKGPAGPQVPAEPFKYIWSEQKVCLVGIGDSITDGFGASNGFSYFERLIKNPPNDIQDMKDKNLSVVFPNLKTKNLSGSGSVSLDHLAQIRRIENEDSNTIGIVVMTTGGNDIIHSYGRRPPKECAMYGATLQEAQQWIENYKVRLEKMVMMLKEKFPGGCHIFLANIYDPSDGTGNTKEFFTGLPPWPDGLAIHKQYNDIIAQCAQNHDHVHLIDIYTPFLGHGIHCKKFWLRHYHISDPHYWYDLNIEDPNDRGYDAIRRLFLIEIMKVFFNENIQKTYKTNLINTLVNNT
ncbi:MAG: SGNH/GDSL hydrolase family protein [Planctomycetota bacterium]|jgi:lysophospholipase L1-like esterase